MQEFESKTLEKKGNSALKLLRKEKHDKGLPFMINAKELPSKQCYLEYSDGRIALVAIASPNDRNFITIRELSLAESNAIRRKFAL